MRQQGKRVLEKVEYEMDRLGFAVARDKKAGKGIYEKSLHGRLSLQ